MAAGLGSRFGGVKQLARVGPGGEAILDFSINDAIAAGFGNTVLIVRSDIETDVRAHLAELHGDDLAGITSVRQDDLGPPRDKPWGTLHAILSAADALDRPFAVINADDYYGPSSFVLAAEHLASSSEGRGANIAFQLGKTVPPSGAVTRALCEVESARLTAIVETDGCERQPDGALWADGRAVPEDTPASMNLWCFHQSVIADFQERWEDFFAKNSGEATSECQLPTVVGELMADGRMVVDVASSSEQWIGITNPDDLSMAQAALADR
ncbi:MAG: hypothetical protein ACI8TP_001968 [Acidimicrobiales bacterium]|jgi:hypothetical protein